MHTCMECDANGTRIVGWYQTPKTRVRVWVCSLHFLRGKWAGRPIAEMPRPAHVQAALDAEAAHIDEREWWWRMNPEARDESVRTLAPTGHGESLGFDRVANWRWGQTSLAKPARV